VPLAVGRPSSRKLLEESLSQSKVIGIVTQRDAEKEEPALEDLYSIGSAVQVLKLLRQPDDKVLIVIQALRRIRLGKAVVTHPFLRTEVEVLHSTAPPKGDKTWEATIRNLRDT